MFSFWFVFVYLMTDVFPPGTWGRRSWGSTTSGAFSERDARDQSGFLKESWGKAKNQKLREMVKAGGPVSLTFDRDVTYTPLGVPSDLFPREAGMYMWRTIPFDKMGWDKVSKPHKDAIMNHLKFGFRMDLVEGISRIVFDCDFSV
ncbi:hypothetical protein HanXRQr2_Chr11g0508021 [Helianthus annuus]|uniref:Uncharacterized protein n=1 Tax=Helianthus annuus TaxID=4232 RepID=A0A9K3HRL0_HELAN|nr:uncharacterized protein LOC110890866 [Helianthus annuus]KAF5783444.1 hypothetical protein HanXRQr2_Chr11g0508021 [Helianthus annuus]KAJ0502767.1 hypothetical protein HanHA300_Chr11g0416661 [Helianthus annuus]KAJ0518727.1 hypothetical protein HanHA89_Chr11g0440691 [Helianthus annuus]KAJ0690562.1 hypothetical protein HanOQP8_Chr11g0419221 [Helianthus annuus]